MTTRMIRPPAIEKGDTLALLAPAGKMTPEKLELFASELERRGYSCMRATHVLDRHHKFAGTDAVRAADLTDLWKREEVKALICVRGGYGSIRSLMHAAADFGSGKPKWLTGFSDITALHLFLQQKGVQSIHGLMPVQYEDGPEARKSLDALLALLSGADMSYRLPPHPLNREGEGSGILTGGNLSVLMSLAGTAWFPDLRGKVLFLEEVGEERYRFDRLLQQLKATGALSQLAGLVVGGLTGLEEDEADPFGMSPEEIVTAVVKEYNYPVLFGFQAGHLLPNLPLVLGQEVQLVVNSTECQLF